MKNLQLKKLIQIKFLIPTIVVILFSIGFIAPWLSPVSLQKVYEYDDEKKFVDYTLRTASSQFLKSNFEKFYIRRVQIKSFESIPEFHRCQIRDVQGKEEYIDSNYIALVQAKTFFNIPVKEALIRCQNYTEDTYSNQIPNSYMFSRSSDVELIIHNDKIQRVAIDLFDFKYAEGDLTDNREDDHAVIPLSLEQKESIIKEINKNQFSKLEANYTCRWWQLCLRDDGLTFIVSDFDNDPFSEHWVRCESYKVCPQEFKNIVHILESYSPRKFEIHPRSKNQTGNTSFGYSNTTYETTVDMDLTHWKIHNKSEWGLSFRYPKEFSVSDGGANMITIIPKDFIDKERKIPSILLSIEKTQQNNLKDWVVARGGDLDSYKQISVDGHDAIQYDTDSEGESELRITYILINDLLYAIIGIGHWSEREFLDVYDAFLDTVKIESQKIERNLWKDYSNDNLSFFYPLDLIELENYLSEFEAIDSNYAIQYMRVDFGVEFSLQSSDSPSDYVDSFDVEVSTPLVVDLPVQSQTYGKNTGIGKQYVYDSSSHRISLFLIQHSREPRYYLFKIDGLNVPAFQDLIHRLYSSIQFE
ncbi:MAG: hypothetical protein A3I91_05695 [Candidatus Kerfeldbacteria bacterium RIFCSPLOWO2_02_FULL_42_19]|nr:MAG: hypothetical protein A3I91_05695 [Candidatus Kerfeldbacteria bacterium RIFCSPLOWO2_02_FULL_42_19]